MKKILYTLIVAIVATSFYAVVFAAETINTDTTPEPTSASPAGEVKVEKKERKKVVKKTKKNHKKAKKEPPVPAPAVTPAPM